MNESDYQNEMQQMFNDKVCVGIYKVTVDNILDVLKTSLKGNVYGKYEHYEKMLPNSKIWRTSCQC